MPTTCPPKDPHKTNKPIRFYSLKGYSHMSRVDNKKLMSVDHFDELTIDAVAPAKTEKRFSAPSIRKQSKFYNRFKQRGSIGVHVADDDSDALCIQDVHAFGIAAGACTTKKYPEENDLRFISADDRSLAISGDKDINDWDRKTIRRRLNWRIGPLKKKETKRKAGNVTASCKSVISASEKTSKSIHTAHSVETARIKNRNNSLVGSRKFLFSSQERKNGTKPSSRLGTIGEFLSTEVDKSDLDDGGTVVALNEDDAFDPDSNQYRSVHFFHKPNDVIKSDLNRHSPARSRKLPPKNPSQRALSSSASTTDVISYEELKLSDLQAVSEGCTERSKSNFKNNIVSTHAAFENSPKTPVKSSKKTTHSNSPSPIHTPSTVASESLSYGEESSVDVQRIQSELNLKAMQHLAMQHLHHSEYTQSVEVLKEMLRGVVAVYGTSHVRVGTVHHNIATLYMRMGEFRKVVFHAQCAIQIRRLNILHTSVSLSDLAVSYTQLGLALLELEEYDISLNMFHKALAIQSKNGLDVRMKKRSKLLNNIGCCLFKLKRLDEANIAFRDALEIQRRLLNTRDKIAHNSNNGESESIKEMNSKLLGIASTVCNLASIHLEKGNHSDAYTYLEEALLLQQSVLGDMHNVSTSTKSSLDLLQNEIDSLNDKQNNYIQDGSCSIGQGIFNAPMKFHNPLESFSDVKSELSWIFDNVLSSEKKCLQCLPTEFSHDKSSSIDDSSHLHWV